MARWAAEEARGIVVGKKAGRGGRRKRAEGRGEDEKEKEERRRGRMKE